MALPGETFHCKEKEGRGGIGNTESCFLIVSLIIALLINVPAPSKNRLMTHKLVVLGLSINARDTCLGRNEETN